MTNANRRVNDPLMWYLYLHDLTILSQTLQRIYRGARQKEVFRYYCHKMWSLPLSSPHQSLHLESLNFSNIQSIPHNGFGIQTVHDQRAWNFIVRNNIKNCTNKWWYSLTLRLYCLYKTMVHGAFYGKNDDPNLPIEVTYIIRSLSVAPPSQIFLNRNIGCS